MRQFTNRNRTWTQEECAGFQRSTLSLRFFESKSECLWLKKCCSVPRSPKPSIEATLRKLCRAVLHQHTPLSPVILEDETWETCSTHRKRKSQSKDLILCGKLSGGTLRGVDWIKLAQDQGRLWVLLKTYGNFELQIHVQGLAATCTVRQADACNFRTRQDLCSATAYQASVCAAKQTGTVI
jgi:hypothetical protein